MIVFEFYLKKFSLLTYLCDEMQNFKLIILHSSCQILVNIFVLQHLIKFSTLLENVTSAYNPNIYTTSLNIKMIVD